MYKTKELTDSNFDETIKKQEKPVLVEFYAPWCGHCRTQTPIIEDLAQEIEDDAVIAKMNVDENPQKPSEFYISGIPAILIFKNGKLAEHKAGVHQKNELKKLISKYV